MLNELCSILWLHIAFQLIIFSVLRGITLFFMLVPCKDEDVSSSYRRRAYLSTENRAYSVTQSFTGRYYLNWYSVNSPFIVSDKIEYLNASDKSATENYVLVWTMITYILLTTTIVDYVPICKTCQ